MQRLAWLASISLVAAACGGSDDNGDTGVDASVEADAAAPQPDADTGDVNPISGPTLAFDSDGVEVGPANWDCLGDPDPVEETENDIEVSGQLSEFLNAALDEYEISAFASLEFDGEPTAGPVECDGDGCDPTEYELTIPAGVTRVAFRVETNNDLVTFTLGHSFESDATEATVNFNVVGDGTASTLAVAALRRDRTAGLGIVAGDVVDCEGNFVRHAIAALSTTSGELAPVAEAERSFYFGGQLPVGARTETQADGRFMIPEITADELVYVQAWGYISHEDFDNDELTLLSELGIEIPEDALITSPFAPLYSEADNGGDD